MSILPDLEVLSTIGHRRSKHKHRSSTIAKSCTVAFIIDISMIVAAHFGSLQHAGLCV